MLYLKCVGIFFLAYSIIEAMKALLAVKDKKWSDAHSIMSYITGWTIGGFWLFLLLKLISNMGMQGFDN